MCVGGECSWKEECHAFVLEQELCIEAVAACLIRQLASPLPWFMFVTPTCVCICLLQPHCVHICVQVAYNFNMGYAFNTYGELAAGWLQDLAVVVLIVRWGHTWGRGLLGDSCSRCMIGTCDHTPVLGVCRVLLPQAM